MRSGALAELTLLPFRMRNFRLSRADPEDAAWLQATLNRDSLAFGTRVALERDNSLSVHW
jgi:poly-gamma-glutamate synthesis protein (capsule biosynthesis protein)